MIGIIFPVYSIDRSLIDRALVNFSDKLFQPIVVINGGNNEALEFSKDLKKRHIQSICIPNQIGKAEAIRRGIEASLINGDVSYIAQVDGRGKQPIDLVFDLVDTISTSDAELVVADRYVNQDLNIQGHRIAISTFFSSIVRLVSGIQLRDVACGTRIYSRRLAIEFTQSKSFGYGIELEQLLIAGRSNGSVISVPTESNRQADGTNAEKIEDNLITLVCCTDYKDLDPFLREKLCFALTKIKKRENFKLDFRKQLNITTTNFEYLGGKTVSAYTNQTLSDAYAVKQMIEIGNGDLHE